MTEYKVLLSEQAMSDIDAIYTHIATRIGMPQSAQNQLNRLADAIDSLKTMPRRINIMRTPYGETNELRQLLVDNYAVIFSVVQETVNIVRILYSASDISSRLQEK
ncbi:MAG: type II toxin-antitoxin system RelE/ParE family toxin [Selenomonadaceae bacterium]|nr:type II toxin-antitoxin system RelE/ParE family toxin [Selenomonadaceae bacterium]